MKRMTPVTAMVLLVTSCSLGLGGGGAEKKASQSNSDSGTEENVLEVEKRAADNLPQGSADQKGTSTASVVDPVDVQDAAADIQAQIEDLIAELQDQIEDLIADAGVDLPVDVGAIDPAVLEKCIGDLQNVLMDLAANPPMDQADIEKLGADFQKAAEGCM